MYTLSFQPNCRHIITAHAQSGSALDLVGQPFAFPSTTELADFHEANQGPSRSSVCPAPLSSSEGAVCVHVRACRARVCVCVCVNMPSSRGERRDGEQLSMELRAYEKDLMLLLLLNHFNRV